MESPFRSEAAAFRFLLISIGAAALIVVASWINPWLGFAVFLALVVVGTWAYVRMRGPAPPKERVHPDGPPDERRVLVVANETVGGEELLDALGEIALAGQARFYAVAPALNTRLKTWTSDEDPARAAAQRRLHATLRRFRDVGIEADGDVGDADPLVAVQDAVRTFRPTEIVVSTHPKGRSNWLERGVVAALRDRYDIPVTHVVVDLEAKGASLRDTPGST
jgi:membrane protein implicated in regulation of membrane protease activity